MSKLDMLRADRDRAASEQDWSRWRCRTVELARMGYVDPPPLETTQAAVMETTAGEKPKRRGRPPKPKCEHGKNPETCLDCDDGLVAA